MATKFIYQVGKNAIEYCRAQGWAAMESGISWPIPIPINGDIKLKYLLYWSQLVGHQQIIHEPFANILVSYPQGIVEEHQQLSTHKPADEIGRFPYTNIARFTPSERLALWDELYDLYPFAIASYAGWPSGNRTENLPRFMEIFSIVIPPYLSAAYYKLNPKFFDWINGFKR